MTEKPKTQRAMVEQLWFVVIGSNGDGLVMLIKQALAQMVDHAKRIGKIEDLLPALWTKEQHEEMHAAYVADQAEQKEKGRESGERRKMSRRELVNYIVTGVLSLAAILVLVFKK